MKPTCRQDLHIHTVFSRNDSAVTPEQTVKLVASVRHAETMGISDHFDSLHGRDFDVYRKELRQFGFYVGTEVGGSEETKEAADMPFDYYIFHCKDRGKFYRAVDTLLATGKPVIIAHPMVMDTDLDRVPVECFVEINNRYVWQADWRTRLAPYIDRFRWILSSDAHQPNWLNQNVSRYVAAELGVQEVLIFGAAATGKEHPAV